MKGRKRVISFAGLDPVVLFGQRERNLQIVEGMFPGNIVVRGDEIILQGSKKEISFLTDFFSELISLARQGRNITEEDMINLLESGGKGASFQVENVDREVVVVTKRGIPIMPKSYNQREYVRAISDYDMVIAIGPAGTGKTFLAVARAVAALKRREIERIILVRPVVEAGESLGYLPGDFQAKLDPYVRPVVDALNDMLGHEKTTKLQDNGTIEVAPLAYMRGRTLNDAYVILDEAQNTTVMQMKMFLTRIGRNAKAIVNGDITQIDLDPPSRSGLVAAKKILSHIKGIKFIELGVEDVVRHSLVQDIINAFARNGGKSGD